MDGVPDVEPSPKIEELPMVAIKPGRYMINPYSKMIKNTIQVASGETWDVQFYTDNPGIWPFHCHLPHHASNNMTDPTGGMFTTINYVSN